MREHADRQFIRALVPVLIGSLPDPLTPSAEDLKRVAHAAEQWRDLITESPWREFLLGQED